MSKIENSKKYCCEDISLIENYEKAVKDEKEIWHCHHRKETDEGYSRKELIEKGLYYDRPANELIFLSKSEHTTIHRLGNHNKGWKLSERTEEHKRKLSEALKGRTSPNKGKKFSEEYKKKLSEAHKGHTVDDETRKKISTGNKGKRKGFKMTEEQKKKLSEAHKGKKTALGHKKSEEAKQKIRDAFKGKTRIKDPETGKFKWIS